MTNIMNCTHVLYNVHDSFLTGCQNTVTRVICTLGHLTMPTSCLLIYLLANTC